MQKWSNEEIELLRINSNEPEKLLVGIFPSRTIKSIKHKIINSGFNRDKLYNWFSKEELVYLKNNYHLEKEELIEYLKRDWNSIRKKLFQLNITHHLSYEMWTEMDVVTLLSTTSTEEALKLLPNRSYNAIIMKANEMGKIFSSPWTNEELKLLKLYYPIMKAYDIAVLLGKKSSHSIYGKAHELGLAKKNVIIDLYELHQYYVEFGLKMNEISKVYGVHRKTIGKLIPLEWKSVNRLTKTVLEDLYVNKNMPLSSIASMFKVSSYTVSEKLKEYGFHIFSGKFESMDVDISDIINMYKEDKMSCVEIAKIIGLSHSFVSGKLRENNVKIRSHSETIGGENHPNWKNGKTPIHMRERELKEYKKWRIDVFKRDQFTCQCCYDKSGGNLEAHHIENFSTNKELRLDESNGITLCTNCHKVNIKGSFHNTYGTKNNNRQQLEEYIRIRRQELGTKIHI